MQKQITYLAVALMLFLTGSGQTTILSGEIKNTAVNSLTCSLIPNNVFQKVEVVTIPVVKGRFHQVLPLTKPTFVSLAEEGNNFSGLLQPGDSVHVTYDAAGMKSSLSFEGKGKEKFSFMQAAKQLLSVEAENRERIKTHPSPIDLLFGTIDSLQNALQLQLTSVKTRMSNESFQLLLAHTTANVLRAKFNGTLSILGSFENIEQQQSARLNPSAKKSLDNLLLLDERLSFSYLYVSNAASILPVYYDNKGAVEKGLQAKYNHLAKLLPSGLKLPVLYLMIEREIRQQKDAVMDTLVNRFFSAAKDSAYKRRLTQRLTEARALKVGMAAPDFVLENEKGAKVRLSTFKGKVIYLDFWFAACTPCHKLFKEIQPVKEHFKKDSSVVFLVVSVDNKETWQQALKKFTIGGYHAYTENKFRDHSIIRDYNVGEYPTTYIIGRNGKIANTKPSHRPEELIREINAAMRE